MVIKVPQCRNGAASIQYTISTRAFGYSKKPLTKHKCCQSVYCIDATPNPAPNPALSAVVYDLSTVRLRITDGTWIAYALHRSDRSPTEPGPLGRLRNLLERPIVGARSEDADHQDHHGHCEGDEGKDAGRAEMQQEEGDHVAVEGRGDATEGVDKSHCPGPNARREQLGLVGVIGIG